MQPFIETTSVIVPLLQDNIDTDAIIPSREIRSVSKTGLADGLFAGWRYLDQNRTVNPNFALNQPHFAGAKILAAGANMGCGSSREQAVWALLEYGFRVVIAPSFNSIFRRNCIRNGILPITLDPAPIVEAPAPVTVNLQSKTITAADGRVWTFALEEEATTMLIMGMDEIELTLTSSKKIAQFRSQDRMERPWAYI